MKKKTREKHIIAPVLDGPSLLFQRHILQYQLYLVDAIFLDLGQKSPHFSIIHEIDIDHIGQFTGGLVEIKEDETS